METNQKQLKAYISGHGDKREVPAFTHTYCSESAMQEDEELGRLHPAVNVVITYLLPKSLSKNDGWGEAVTGTFAGVGVLVVDGAFGLGRLPTPYSRTPSRQGTK